MLAAASASCERRNAGDAAVCEAGAGGWAGGRRTNQTPAPSAPATATVAATIAYERVEFGAPVVGGVADLLLSCRRWLANGAVAWLSGSPSTAPLVRYTPERPDSRSRLTRRRSARKPAAF